MKLKLKFRERKRRIKKTIFKQNQINKPYSTKLKLKNNI